MKEGEKLDNRIVEHEGETVIPIIVRTLGTFPRNWKRD